MTKISELSIFFPFWNEEKNIEEVVMRAIPIAEKVAKNWEILIIDDGSTDKTLEKANNIASKNKNIRVITHSPNRGYGAAIKEGLENANFQYVVFNDGDLQFDFSEVTKFIELIKNNDLVIGFRQQRKDNLIRHLLMNLLKLWDYLFFGFNFKDIDCGFKMFKKDAINELMPLRSEGAMITTEILAKAKRKKLKIAQVSVTHYPRLHGDETGANFFVVARAVLESLTLWWDMKNGRF